MLNETNAAATIAVKDLAKARKFYEGVLGLQREGGDEQGVLNYKSGNSSVVVYQSSFAGTNQATAATWTVKSVDSEVSALKAKGVSFEHYVMPGVTLKGDVHLTGKTKAAWFKDPDGNILAIVGP